MKVIERSILIGGICGLFAFGAAAQSPEGAPLPLPKLPPVAPAAPADDVNFGVSGRFTAQRRPRVTVWEFEDSNAQAREARYGDSVEAMLVTFLKRKTQFVVVERQHLGGVYEEWQRMQKGMIGLEPEDAARRALLERLDAFILGHVTVLDIPTTQVTAPTQEPKELRRDPPKDSQGGPQSESRSASSSGTAAAAGASSGRPERELHGPRIEVDAKLLSRSDGRIIAAAQRSGTVACLRSIVERLGIALEQEFLRPYYGRLRFTLKEPSHVNVHLTPILLDTALDEEKPPVELSSTVRIGTHTDIIEAWTTNSTSYTIENLLSGWYSMRLERPGYEAIGTQNARWEARNLFGQVEVFDRQSGQPLARSGPEKRFVVRVEALSSRPEHFDGDELGLTFRKLGGSLAPSVKRQYLDKDFSHRPERVVLIGGVGLDINPNYTAEEFATDTGCDVFDERKGLPHDPPYGRTYVAADQPFHFDSFTGGELIIEKYQGEVVPTGRYEIAIWEPHYQLDSGKMVTIRDGDRDQLARFELTREVLPLELEATGAKPPHHAVLEGRDTAHHVKIPLDFDKTERPGLPVDTFIVSTDVEGLEGWQKEVSLFPPQGSPPVFDTKSPIRDPKLIDPPVPPETRRHVLVKTRLGIAGRREVLSSKLDPLVDDVFIDEDALHVLNLLLYEEEERPGKERSRLLEFASRAGQFALEALAETLAVNRPGADQPESTKDQGKLAAPTNTAATPPGPAAASPGSNGPNPLTEAMLKLLAEPPPPGAQGEDRTALMLALAVLAAQQPQGAAPPSAASAPPGPAPQAEPPPSPPRFPRERDKRLELLAKRLEVIDLLVLDPQDMSELRKAPDVAEIIAGWVVEGGALFAFVHEIGDYAGIVGAPLAIEAVSKPTDRFELAVGDVPDIVPRFDRKKKLEVKSARALPEVPKLKPGGPWRVVAFTQGQKQPRILERGKREEGGYVALWLDDPETFLGRMGGTVPEVEETRARLERRVLEAARYLMHRRYDTTGEQRQPAQQDLTH